MIERKRDAIAGEPGAAVFDGLPGCVAAEGFAKKQGGSFAELEVQGLCE